MYVCRMISTPGLIAMTMLPAPCSLCQVLDRMRHSIVGLSWSHELPSDVRRRKQFVPRVSAECEHMGMKGGPVRSMWVPTQPCMTTTACAVEVNTTVRTEETLLTATNAAASGGAGPCATLWSVLLDVASRMKMVSAHGPHASRVS